MKLTHRSMRICKRSKHEIPGFAGICCAPLEDPRVFVFVLWVLTPHGPQC